MDRDDRNEVTKMVPAEEELLALLLEELGEVVHVVGKVLRHGFNSANPEASQPVMNRQMLISELGDVMAAQLMLVQAGLVGQDDVVAAAADKLRRVQKWLHHEANKGRAMSALHAIDVGEVVHEGIHAVRLEQNPAERIFASRWKDRQERQYGFNGGHSLLECMLAQPGKKVGRVTRDQARVAATVVQWLGSPLGRAFVDECRDEVNGKRR